MKYSEALEYIGSFKRFSHPASLDRIDKLMKRLHSPEKKMRFIHIAGTNGKGSTAAYIASVLSFSGIKCGLYTSPYIYDFTERVKIDGRNVSKRRFASAVSAIIKLGVTPADCTQFEVVTAAAFICFAKEKCGTVVLETGIGGRFDATNIITEPLCSVITSVSLDHMAVLGDTVEKIATEKLGIVKNGGVTVISAANKPSVLELARERAKEKNNRLFTADIAEASDVVYGTDGISFVWHGRNFRTGMAGSFQLENAVTALTVLEAVYPELTERAVTNGLFTAKMPCRFEKLSDNPPVIIDGAHNEGGMRALVENLRSLYGGRKIYAVTAMCGDKDYVRVAGIIAAVADTVWVTEAGTPRSLPAHELGKEAQKYCKNVTVEPNPHAAFRKALRLARREKGESLVVLCGSLYLPKAVFGRLGKRKY